MRKSDYPRASKSPGPVAIATFATIVKSGTVYYTAVKKQWTTKWPYIAKAVFRIVQNHGK